MGKMMAYGDAGCYCDKK